MQFTTFINYYENLPSNWIITNFSNVISLTSGTDLESSEYSIKDVGVPYLTGASNIDDNLDIVVNRYTNFKYVNSHKDEILLTCKGTVGKVVQNTIGDVHVARQFMSIKSFINLDYTKIYLETLVSFLNSEAKSIIPGIDRKQVLNKIILLPPQKEQELIVDKVMKLLQFIQ